MKSLYAYGYVTMKMEYKLSDANVREKIDGDYHLLERCWLNTKRFCTEQIGDCTTLSPFFSPFELTWFGVGLSLQHANTNLSISSLFVRRQSGGAGSQQIRDPFTAAGALFKGLLAERVQLGTTSPVFKSEQDGELRSDSEFVKLFQGIARSFNSYNFHLVKLEIAAHCYHVLLPLMLYMNSGSVPAFYQVLWCTKTTSVSKYLDAIASPEIGGRFYVIVHPEFLADSEKNFLREYLKSRMVPIPNMQLPFLLIVSSEDFGVDERDGYLTKVNDNLVTTAREASAFRRKYMVSLVTSESCGSGKSTHIRQMLGKHTSAFVDMQNCCLPELKENVHLCVEKSVFEKGVEFWDELWRIMNWEVSLRQTKEPLRVTKRDIHICIEEPEPNFVRDLNAFCCPLLSGEKILVDRSPCFEGTFFQGVLSVSSCITEVLRDLYQSDQIPHDVQGRSISYIKTYLNWLVDSWPCQGKLENRPRVVRNLFAKLALKSAFFIYNLNPNNKVGDFSLLLPSTRTCTYQFFTTNPVSELFSGLKEKDVDTIKQIIDVVHCGTQYPDQFSMFRRISQILSELMLHQSASQSSQAPVPDIAIAKIHDLCYPPDDWKSGVSRLGERLSCSDKDLLKRLDDHDEALLEEAKSINVNGRLVLENIDILWSLLKTCGENLEGHVMSDLPDLVAGVFEHFRNNNGPDVQILASTSITWPTFFRLMILYTRIRLNQPTILFGDTGCGKTSFFELAFCLINWHSKVKMQKMVMNISGDVTHDSIQKWIDGPAKTATNPLIFFDELNTSEACGYIEYLILNSGKPIIGAVNIREKTGEISQYLSKVGMPQKLITYADKARLISSDQTEGESLDMSAFKYFVHPLSKVSSSVMLNCNPWLMNGESDPLLPLEEELNIKFLIYQLQVEFRTQLQDSLELFTQCTLAAYSWLRHFTTERAAVSYRDIRLCFNMLCHFLTIGQQMELAIIFAVFVTFCMRMPRVLKVSNPSEVVQRHLSDFERQRRLTFEKRDNTYFVHARTSLLRVVCQKWNELSKDVQEMNAASFLEQFDKFVFEKIWDENLKPARIWKFRSFLYHLFIIKACMKRNLACFILGLPGTCKTYAVEHIAKTTEGLFCSNYLCSRGASSDGIKAQCLDTAYTLVVSRQEHQRILERLMALDELGLLNYSQEKPGKLFHFVFDHGIEAAPGKHVKLPIVALTNYAMDFANMNRGIPFFTDIPSVEELIHVFDVVCLGNVVEAGEFLQSEGNCSTPIAQFFTSIWEGSPPESIALRSIYQLIEIWRKLKVERQNPPIPLHVVCQIARELMSAQRLLQESSPLHLMTRAKSLFESWHGHSCDQDILNESLISNMILCLERLGQSTLSQKSLCIVTNGYSAVEFLDDIKWMDKILGNINIRMNLSSLVDSWNRDGIEEILRELPDDFDVESDWFFAEDYKQSVSDVCRRSVERIVDFFESRTNTVPIIVGNHPVLDSLLGVLNTQFDTEGQSDRTVTIAADGFSTTYVLSGDQSKFYVILVVEREEISKEVTDFPLPLLDRLEMVPLDWADIKYISLLRRMRKWPRSKRQSLTRDSFEKIDQELQSFFKVIQKREYDPKKDQMFHSSMVDLYNWYDNSESTYAEHETVVTMLKNEWERGITAVIVTRSNITDAIDEFMPQAILIDDFMISNSKELSEKLNLFISNARDVDSAIFIRCNRYSKLHDQHIKQSLLECKKRVNRRMHIFIIYYQCLDSIELMTPTVKWPIFWMDDIAKYDEGTLCDSEILDIWEKLKTGETDDKAKTILERVIHGMFTQLRLTDKCISPIRANFNRWYEQQDSRSFLRMHFQHANFVLDPEKPNLSSHAQLVGFVRACLSRKFPLFLNIFTAYHQWLANTRGEGFDDRLQWIAYRGDIFEDEDTMADMWVTLSEQSPVTPFPGFVDMYINRLKMNYPFFLASDDYAPSAFFRESGDKGMNKDILLFSLHDDDPLIVEEAETPEQMFRRYVTIPGFNVEELQQAAHLFWNKAILDMIQQDNYPNCNKCVNFAATRSSKPTLRQQLFSICHSEPSVFRLFDEVDEGELVKPSMDIAMLAYQTGLLNVAETSPEQMPSQVEHWLQDNLGEKLQNVEHVTAALRDITLKQVALSDDDARESLTKLSQIVDWAPSRKPGIRLEKSVFELVQNGFDSQDGLGVSQDFIDWFCQGVSTGVTLMSLQAINCIAAADNPQQYHEELVCLSGLMEPWRHVTEPSVCAMSLLHSVSQSSFDDLTSFDNFVREKVPNANHTFRIVRKAQCYIEASLPTFARCIWSFFAHHLSSKYEMLGQFIMNTPKLQALRRYVRVFEFIRKLSSRFQMKLPALFVLLNCTSLLDNGKWPLLSMVARQLFHDDFVDLLPITQEDLGGKDTAYEQLNVLKAMIIKNHNELVHLLGCERLHRVPFRHFLPEMSISNFSLCSFCLPDESGQPDHTLQAFDIDVLLARFSDLRTSTCWVLLTDDPFDFDRKTPSNGSQDLDIFGLTDDDWKFGLDRAARFSLRNVFRIDEVATVQSYTPAQTARFFLIALLAVYDSRLREHGNVELSEMELMVFEYGPRSFCKPDDIETSLIYKLLPTNITSWFSDNLV